MLVKITFSGITVYLKYTRKTLKRFTRNLFKGCRSSRLENIGFSVPLDVYIFVNLGQQITLPFTCPGILNIINNWDLYRFLPSGFMSPLSTSVDLSAVHPR